jgi:hypothetical protein
MWIIQSQLSTNTRRHCPCSGSSVLIVRCSVFDNRASESHEGRFSVEEGRKSSPRDLIHIIICSVNLWTNFRTPDSWSQRNERSDQLLEIMLSYNSLDTYIASSLSSDVYFVLHSLQSCGGLIASKVLLFEDRPDTF